MMFALVGYLEKININMFDVIFWVLLNFDPEMMYVSYVIFFMQIISFSVYVVLIRFRQRLSK